MPPDKIRARLIVLREPLEKSLTGQIAIRDGPAVWTVPSSDAANAVSADQGGMASIQERVPAGGETGARVRAKDVRGALAEAWA